MNISFTGINNIRIAKKEYSKIGLYQNLSLSLKEGKKNYTEIKISASLTNDEQGNDLTDYIKRLPYRYINSQVPANVDFFVKRFDVPVEHVSQSHFKLNDKDLILDNDNKLPIMTFLARLTRECGNDPRYSSNQQKYLKLANDSIQTEAVNYIENR